MEIQRLPKSYLIEYWGDVGKYQIFSMDDLCFDEESKITCIAENISPDIISAAIYRLLEELKEKKEIDEENSQQAARTVEQNIEFIFDALTAHFEEMEKLHEEIKRIDSSFNTIHLALHSIGNMVAGKIGTKELELIVKHMITEALETHRELK